MKKLVLCLAIMCIALQGYSFNIGTNSFEFVFEDTSIPNNNKAQIISDFTDIITVDCKSKCTKRDAFTFANYTHFFYSRIN